MDDLLELMLEAARAGAAEIMDVYARPIEVEHKPDGSPVTAADRRAERAILAVLAPTEILPIAEESALPASKSVPEERFFCIDPLDGTKEFVKRNGEFTVNIALVQHGRPTHGVIIAPATGATFAASPGRAFEVDSRAQRLPLRTNPEPPFRVVASRSHGHEALRRFCHSLEIVEDVSVGSSLKFCLLARGDAQLYPRFTPTSAWDTAAGQAILEAAGGAVLTLDGEPLRYKPSGDRLNPHFIAAASPALARRAAAEMQRSLNES